MTPCLRPVLAAASLLLVAGCAAPLPTETTRATAILAPTTGSKVTGRVNFTQTASHVVVSGEVRGLKPNGEHGFHVHERGDCSSGDASSAGGHFNPTTQPHGRQGAGPHHTGDMPPIKANAAGVAIFRFEVRTIRIGSEITNVLGRGLVIHRDPDNFRTQPSGGSGPPVACGVIVKA